MAKSDDTLNVDQRVNKAFSADGLGAASKMVASDPARASASNFVDEATSAGSAAIVSGAIDERPSGLMAPDGTSFDAGFVSSDASRDSNAVSHEVDHAGDPTAFEPASSTGAAALDGGLVSDGSESVAADAPATDAANVATNPTTPSDSYLTE